MARLSAKTTGRLLSFGTILCSIAMISTAVMNVITGFATSFVPKLPESAIAVIAIVLLSLLLMLSAVVQSERLVREFGFLRHRTGSGATLLLVGSLVLTLSMSWPVGLAVGIVSMVSVSKYVMHVLTLL